MWVDVCCRPQCVGCNSVTRHYLHGLCWVVINLDFQLYNTSATHRHQSQGLETSNWHRRLSTNISHISLWQWEVYLADVYSRWRHKALTAKVSIWHIQTIQTVSNINSPACDVTRHPSTDTVWLRWQWTETCSTTGLHHTMARRGVTSWNIHYQSAQWTTEPASTHWSQYCRTRTSSVQSFTLHWTHRRRLSRQHSISWPVQSSYSAAWQSSVTSSCHHRWTSTQLRAAMASLLHGTVRTTAGWVGRRSGSVWCASSLDELIHLIHSTFCIFMTIWLVIVFISAVLFHSSVIIIIIIIVHYNILISLISLQILILCWVVHFNVHHYFSRNYLSNALSVFYRL